MSQTYTFSYHVTPAMVKRSILIVGRQQSSARRRWPIYLSVAVIGLTVGVLGSYFGLFDGFSADVLLHVLVGFYMSILVWFIIYRYDVRRHVNEAQHLLERQGEVHMGFSQEGVELRSDLGVAHFNWVAFEMMTVTKELVLLKLSNAIYPIPRDAVPADMDFDAFQADVKTWHEAAQ